MTIVDVLKQAVLDRIRKDESAPFDEFTIFQAVQRVRSAWSKMENKIPDSLADYFTVWNEDWFEIFTSVRAELTDEEDDDPLTDFNSADVSLRIHIDSHDWSVDTQKLIDTASFTLVGWEYRVPVSNVEQELFDSLIAKGMYAYIRIDDYDDEIMEVAHGNMCYRLYSAASWRESFKQEPLNNLMLTWMQDGNSGREMVFAPALPDEWQQIIDQL